MRTISSKIGGTCSGIYSVSLRVLVCVLVFFSASVARAQQPFVTDDSDVTPKGRFHFEFSNEFDRLQRDAFPSRSQNIADFELNYGLLKNVEIGVEVPIITIVNDRSVLLPGVTGIGDMNLSLKYNFRQEREHSPWPAFAVALNVEVPTGDVKRQLGSGLADVYVNGILQKSLTGKTTLRLNGGILFSGNETTGVIGIRTRGVVLTGGGSVRRQFTERLNLGAEVAGALARNLDLSKGQVRVTVGGNYSLNDKMSFDFGLIGGRYIASPRLGVLLGLSIDF